MENLLTHARAVIAEQLRLIEVLIELARETRKAILARSVDDLNQLGARHQNALVRLEIVRQSEARLHKSLVKEAGLDEGTGLVSALLEMGEKEEVERLQRLVGALSELNRLNRENGRLLEKQFVGVAAFQQVLELVSGVGRVYDRDGSLRRLDPEVRIEENR